MMLTSSSFAVCLFVGVGLVCVSVNCDLVNQQQPSMADTFNHCLVSQPGSTLGHCFGVGAISKLQSLDSDAQFDLIDGLTLIRDQQEYRAAYNLADRDPADFRTWMDSLSHVFSARSMLWDMGSLYPGLGMRVAPSAGSGQILEFVLDPAREAMNKHSLKEAGTGRLLARQFLVPFLLGFKFNVAAIIPILFGLLALLAKKALIISKIALVVSSAYGLGSLLLGNGNKVQPSGYQTSFNPAFGGHYHNRFPEDANHEYHGAVYRGAQENDVDQLTLFGKFEREAKEATKGRNFAWDENEKSKAHSKLTN